MKSYEELKKDKEDLESKRHCLNRDIESIDCNLQELKNKIRYLEKSSDNLYEVGDYLISSASYYFNENEIDCSFEVMIFKGKSDFGLSGEYLYDEFDVIKLSIAKNENRNDTSLYFNKNHGVRCGSTTIVDGCSYSNYVLCGEETAKYCIRRMKEIAASVEF